MGFAARLGKKYRYRWNNAVRPSRRPLRGLLRMTIFLNAIIDLRHGEERPGEAGARLEPRRAAMQGISCPASALSPSYDYDDGDDGGSSAEPPEIAGGSIGPKLRASDNRSCGIVTTTVLLCSAPISASICRRR